MYVPEYVAGEPRDQFDHITFFGYRDVIDDYKKWKKKFDSDYNFNPSVLTEEAINAKTIKNAYKGNKRKYWKFIKWVFELKNEESQHVNFEEE